MPNKLTDAEIKKALECCIEPAGKCMCRECPLHHRDGSCTTLLVRYALDLINRQEQALIKSEKVEHFADKTIATLQAENESLKTEVERLRESRDRWIKIAEDFDRFSREEERMLENDKE